VWPAEAIVGQLQAVTCVAAFDGASDATLHLSLEHWIVAGEALRLGVAAGECEAIIANAVPMSVLIFLIIASVS
jgi:hypothetical protein